MIHAELQAIKRRLDELGVYLAPEEEQGVKGNIATGGSAWKALRRVRDFEEARALIEAVMHAQARHLNTDYDSIPKWGMDDDDLDELRDDCSRQVRR